MTQDKRWQEGTYMQYQIGAFETKRRRPFFGRAFPRTFKISFFRGNINSFLLLPKRARGEDTTYDLEANRFKV